MFNTITKLTEKVNTLTTAINTQVDITNTLNTRLMEATMNGGKGTGTLERHAAASAKKEENLKKALSEAKAELKNAMADFDSMIARANAALAEEDTSAIDAVFDNLEKPAPKKEHKRDLAADRAVARNLDMDRYAEKCIKEQEKADKQAEITQKTAEPKTEEPKTEPVVGQKEDLTNKERNARAKERAKVNAEQKANAPKKEVVEPIGKPESAAKAVDNKEEEVATMKDVTNAKRLAHVLKQAKMPQKVIDTVVDNFSVTDMREIVFADLKEKLMYDREGVKIPGIGEKRAETIIRVLTGRIPEPLAIKKLTADMREQKKAEIREKAKGFSCPIFEAEELFRNYMDRIVALAAYRPQKDEKPEILIGKRQDLARLRTDIKTGKALTVRYNQRKIIRLTKSAISEVSAVDYESRRPTNKLFVLKHDVQKLFDLHWKLFSNDKDEGQRLLEEYQQDIMYHIGYYGVRVIYEDGNTKLFGGVGSSPSHQKGEKLLMADAKIIKANERFFWFGGTMQDFVHASTLNGAEFWKARANLLRPWMKPFMTKDGNVLNVRTDVLPVKDLAKVYEILNARRIGKKNGKNVHDGPTTEEVLLGDGAMIAVYELAFQGQCSGLLYKGFLADGTSSIEALCKKHGISVEDFMDTMVEGIDGKMHRLGDYKVICGEGCWKGDKAFMKIVGKDEEGDDIYKSDFEAYLKWVEEMAKLYPGIDNLYLLRQAEEIEDEDKVRRLTASLIRQWLYMEPSEQRALTLRARKQLKKAKTFAGAIQKLAGLFKSEEERTEVEKLFRECPWLVMAPAIQEYLSESWKRKQIEALSGKFRTEGQYPYIMQDPVALLEVWVLGMNPNDPDLGILREGEVSCCDVQDGRELLCVRFPANFLTAMVKKNRACKTEFASLNGVLVLSVHDLILIAQDGDVDGDEMCVIYNETAIKLTKRMQEEFNPPIVLFNHEKTKKNKRKPHGSIEHFIRDAYTALWRAKRYDSVGIYANLASRCAYLAAIAHRYDNAEKREKYLLWMSAASTGAILAIDQVKGVETDASLIKWLENINKWVRGIFKNMAKAWGYSDDEAEMMIHPYTQFYVAAAKHAPIDQCQCLPYNKDNFVDETTKLVERDTGTWEFKAGKAVFDSVAAEEALTDGRPRMMVPYGKVTQEMRDLLADNWFKLSPKAGDVFTTDEAENIRARMNVGAQIGMKDFIKVLYQNETSMFYVMEGRQLWEKKEEYADTCRKLLRMLCESCDWSKKEGISTPEDRWNVLVNALIRDALELNLGTVTRKNKETGELETVERTNGMTRKGSYAMFVLRVLAADLRKNAAKNHVDNARFCITNQVEEAERAVDEAVNEEEAELFELPSAPAPVEEDDCPPFESDESTWFSAEDDDVPPEEYPEC